MKKHISKFSPKTNKIIYDVELTSCEQVDNACANAKNAFKNWEKTSLDTRKKYLLNLIDVIKNNSERIIQTIISDVEKPYCEAETEVIESSDILEYYCLEKYEGIDLPVEIAINNEIWSHKRAYGLYHSCGVYAVIKPWNYPFELPIWAIAPLLLAGNTIVFKPSEYSTATGNLLGELINDAGLPEGVFNVINGDGSVGEYLLKNDDIIGISFTGSSLVGNEILNKPQNIRRKLSIETGGSDFAIVLNDEIEHITLPGLLWGGFSNAGQVCVAIEKVLISDKIYDDFVLKLVNETKKLNLQVEISPIISQKQYAHAQTIINDVIEHGGKILFGEMEYLNSLPQKGNYMVPTIIECKDLEYLSKIEEIFAPVMFVAPFNNEKDAIETVNSSRYGLGCSIWTSDYEQHSNLIKELDVGMIWINEVNLPLPQVPWQGIKDSGLGFNLSQRAVYDAMNFKAVHIDEDNKARSWWFPYSQD